MKRKQIRRILCFVMLVAIALSAAACGRSEKTPTEPTYETLPSITVENPVTYFSMYVYKDSGMNSSIDVSMNEENGAYVQYTGQEKKVGNFDAGVFHNIADAVERAELAALNGQSVFEEGESWASMYIEFADGTAYTANYSGVIPEAYLAAYEKMDAFFQILTAELPVYVPQAQVVGDVDAEALAAMQEILGQGVDGVDAFYISEVAKDAYFGYTLGLSDTDGIAVGVLCAPYINVTPYSFALVTLSEDADISAVAADFAAHVDWYKWVCTCPSNALIAYKDNMVLCLVGSDTLYRQTADAVMNAGWTEYKTMKNPNM